MNARAKRAGLTAQVINFPVNPAISPAAMPAVVARGRVVIERPAPAPVRRTCPYCHAIFDDHTQRPNTVYCRASCRVMMSRLKKQTAIDLLTTLTNAPVASIADAVEARAMKETELLIKKFGYTFSIADKSWVKRSDPHDDH